MCDSCSTGYPHPETAFVGACGHVLDEPGRCPVCRVHSFPIVDYEDEVTTVYRVGVLRGHSTKPLTGEAKSFGEAVKRWADKYPERLERSRRMDRRHRR